MKNRSSWIQNLVESVSSSVGVLERNENGDIVVVACNDSFFDMLGGPRAIHDFPYILDALVPSYARRELRQAVLECLQQGAAQELEQAYDLRGGTRWWRLSLKPLRLDAAEAAPSGGVLLTGIDITPKIELQHQLEVSTSRFRSVVDAAYDAIITIDQQHRITLFNRAAEQLFGYDQSEMLDQPLAALIPQQYRDTHQENVHQFARSPVKSRQMDERNRIFGVHRDGSHVPVEIAISKINVDGLIEFTAVIRDISDKVHLMDLLEKQASTDPLTGLVNRRAFDMMLGRMMKPRHPRTMVSILLLDIDHFKTINDTHGHDAGDEVLRLLAKAGLDTVRQSDLFARFGGEEFVVALPDADEIEARQMGERLRQAFAARVRTHDWKGGPAIPFTVSIGVASRRADDHDAASIIKRADQALYRAKNAGRDRIEVE